MHIQPVASPQASLVESTMVPVIFSWSSFITQAVALIERVSPLIIPKEVLGSSGVPSMMEYTPAMVQPFSARCPRQSATKSPSM